MPLLRIQQKQPKPQRSTRQQQHPRHRRGRRPRLPTPQQQQEQRPLVPQVVPGRATLVAPARPILELFLRQPAKPPHQLLVPVAALLRAMRPSEALAPARPPPATLLNGGILLPRVLRTTT